MSISCLAWSHVLILFQVALEFSDFGGEHFVLHSQRCDFSLCDLDLRGLALACRLFRLLGLFELLDKLAILLL